MHNSIDGISVVLENYIKHLADKVVFDTSVRTGVSPKESRLKFDWYVPPKSFEILILALECKNRLISPIFEFRTEDDASNRRFLNYAVYLYVPDVDKT